MAHRGSLLLVTILLLSPTSWAMTLANRVSHGESRTKRTSVDNLAKLVQLLHQDKMEARSAITAFVTDPALLVTILHTLEVAYWTLPFGFILTPLINLFRMPNRRMSSDSLSDTLLTNQQRDEFYHKLNSALEKIHKLNRQN